MTTVQLIFRPLSSPVQFMLCVLFLEWYYSWHMFNLARMVFWFATYAKMCQKEHAKNPIIGQNVHDFGPKNPQNAQKCIKIYPE